MRAIAALVLALLATGAAAEPLPPAAQELLGRAQARDRARFAQSMAMKPEIVATTDGRAYALAWKPVGRPPERWIATLHGHASHAAIDLVVWRPFLEPRGIGLIALQWWFGGGERPSDYYAPDRLHRELDAALTHAGATPGRVLLHGFSRGASNVYVVAAIDGTGKRWFSHVVANAGGLTPDYPPNRTLTGGGFGATPFAGQIWITACGARDPMPNRDGCPAMRAAANTIRSMGGTVALAIEDLAGDHGAFHRNPDNVKRALDLFAAAR